jgi:hypothetical protein
MTEPTPWGPVGRRRPRARQSALELVLYALIGLGSGVMAALGLLHYVGR